MTSARLWRVAGDFITYVQAFGASAGAGFPAPNELRSKLLALLEPVARGGAPAEVEEARFALIAWADEVILKTSWPGHAEWLREPLQMRMLHTNRGGDLFFEHLAKLRPEQVAAREIYFLTLALGFEGQLQSQPQDRQRLIHDQYRLMSAGGRALETRSETHLAPAAYELDVELPREAGSSFLLRLLWLGIGLAAVYGLLWVALAFLASEVPVPRGL